MFSCFSLLFFYCSDLGPVQMASARVFTTCQWRWRFPVCQICQKVAVVLYQSVAGLTISYEYVRGRNSQRFLPFPFLFPCTVTQPRRSAPKEGDNVMATCDCSRVTAILYSRLATRLKSLPMILPLHQCTITGIHVCNRIPPITIRMPIRPFAGIRALT